ncbi:MAG: hypothetical protein QXF75_05705 [Candidatus Bathyarchaeia archaeon]
MGKRVGLALTYGKIPQIFIADALKFKNPFESIFFPNSMEGGKFGS